MVVNNPYIGKVKNDSDILTQSHDIYLRQWKWWEYFWNSNPLVLEIGTGMGNFFGKQVWIFPEKNFIGMEIRYKRLFQTANKARQNPEHHFVMLKDFGQNINKIFWEWEVSETYIFFPDPWANKDRQRKNRLLQEDFLRKLYTITTDWWKIFIKSDHKEYFESTKTIIESLWLWKIQKWSHDYENSDIFDMNNITEFEWFYRGEKTDINYMELIKVS